MKTESVAVKHRLDTINELRVCAVSFSAIARLASFDQIVMKIAAAQRQRIHMVGGHLTGLIHSAIVAWVKLVPLLPLARDLPLTHAAQSS